MKKLFPFLLLAWTSTAMAQMTTTQSPTGTPPPSLTSSEANAAWYRGGNNTGGSYNNNNIFGTLWNSEVHHYTGGTRKFTTTVNNGLTNVGFGAAAGTFTGDGISIHSGPNASFASIDLFTSSANQTHIRMGVAGLLQTSSNRFEQYAGLNGFWYSATGIGGTPQFIWNFGLNERGRLGSNGWWHFGHTAVNGGNMVEIQSNATTPYGLTGSGLRLKNLPSTVPLTAIVPNGVNGVNNTRVLTTDQNGDVVLTTVGTGLVSGANNGILLNSAGIIQLGGKCGIPAEVNAARLQSTRDVYLNNYNLIFSEKTTQKGRVGIGDILNCNPGNLLEVAKDNINPSLVGMSGLRLRDLKAGAGAVPYNGRVLGVDNNGDVILMAGPPSGAVTMCFPNPPIDNVVKVNGPNSICRTNITDTYPMGMDGINNTAPNDALDVSPGITTAGIMTGNIDVTSPFMRYEINDLPVLWHKGNVNDIFVGVGAAVNNVGGSGNTVVGHDAAGNSLNLGNDHTLVGITAGMNINGGQEFTMIGARAGFNHPGGGLTSNTFVGADAGWGETGAENVYIGKQSGMNAGIGFSTHNTFVGDQSGLNNNTGSANAFLGMKAGTSNVIGNYNTAVGYGANFSQPNLTNASAIGANAIATNSDQMILGTIPVNVGIGLSGDIFGPQNKLEIDAGLNGTLPSIGAGASGLRFRDLHAANLTQPNPGLGVLSVDANGDVIYVPSGTSSGGGNVSMCFPNPPIDNVVKVTAPNTICGTNITDQFPIFNTVGINNSAPNDALDVSPGNMSGDIDVTSPTNRYEINDLPVLWHKGNTDNIYVGVGAANNNTLGTDDVVVGKDAAPLGNDIGQRMTIVGKEAGYNLGAGGFGGGQDYTLIGYRAGYDNQGNSTNTFLGSEAGYHDLGDENVFVGWKSGYNIPGGFSVHNTFVGNVSGLNNVTGANNTFIGIASGMGNVSGIDNVSLGAFAGPSNPAQQNSIALGAGAQVTGSNEMILGSIPVNVGIGLSGATPGPQNKLEVDAGLNGTLPSIGGGGGASGIRLRDLHSANTTVPNPGPGVLSVDPNGDIIYVPAPSGGGSSVGNYCTMPTNPLATSYEVPLNTWNYSFSGDGVQSDKVNIGYPCSTWPLKGKLNVITSFQSDQTPGSNESYSIHAVNNNTTFLSKNIGVYGEANNVAINFPVDEIGVYGKAINGTRANYGVFGEGGQSFVPSLGGVFESKFPNNPTNIGMRAEAENSVGSNIAVQGTAIAMPGSNSIGGDFTAYSNSASFQNIGVSGRGFPFGGATVPTYPIITNIGVFGQAQNTTSLSDFAGYFDGSVYINSVINGTGYATTSDQKFKSNINPIEDGLSIIKQLKPKTYFYDTKNKYGIHFSDQKQYGVIAQEVEKVMPELIVESRKPAMADKDGKIVTEAVDYKAVNYDGFIAVLIRSVQQLEEQNAQQTELIKSLAERLDKLEKSSSSTTTKGQSVAHQIDVNLSNEDVVVLDQNVPNPFAESTIIRYNIPSNYKTAEIIIKSLNGKDIKHIQITKRGAGQLNVFAQDLSSGVYTYSLVLDGQIVDTKKMMKSE